MKNKFVISAVLISSLMLTSCTKNPATGGRDFMLMSEDSEYELGHETVRNYIKDHGLYKEKPELTKYYQDLARNLVDVTERSEMPFEFIMLDSESFNAWAVPGYINMYRGILPFFNSEAEFMAVMSHEAGHITARHSARSQSAATAANVLLTVGAIMLGTNTDHQQTAQVALGAGLFAANVGFAKYSRSNEDESDMLALRYMEKMGYDPKEAYNIYKTMGIYRGLKKSIYRYFNNGEEPPKSPYYDLFDSHPNSEDRMVKVIERAGGIPTFGVSPSRDKYLDIIDGIAFGPNFRQYGTVGERTIYSPKSRYKLTMPKGFYVAHIDGYWQAHNSITKTKASLQIKKVDKNEDPEETLRVIFPKLRQLQRIDINGLTAYTGVQPVIEKKAFSKNKIVAKQRVFGIKSGKAYGEGEGGKGRKFFTLIFETDKDKFTKLDEKFFDSAYSFKVLTSKQANKLRSVQIKVHKVKKGETVASLAEKMAIGDLKEQWFRALNGMVRKDKLTVGQKVKLIFDPNV